MNEIIEQGKFGITDLNIHDVVGHLSYEYARYLETEGTVFSYHDKNFPMGKYALDLLELENADQLDESGYFRRIDFPDKNFGIITRKGIEPEEISGNFENFITDAQTLVLAIRSEKGEFILSQPVVVPDGVHFQSAWTCCEQYGQGCFEGIVGSVGENGELVIVRPSEHAKRFENSCKFLGIPSLSIELFQECLAAAVKSNKRYWPKDNTGKLYIRPYVKALHGGYKVDVADAFVFCFQVFQFGSLTNGDGLSLVGIEVKRRSSLGGGGQHKITGNYAHTVVDRRKAKAGNLYDWKQPFDDTFYFGDKLLKRETIDGNIYQNFQEVLDEASAGNMLFIKNERGSMKIITPCVERDSFLPGITRKHVLSIAEYLGIPIEERDISVSEFHLFDGAWVAGSAMGLKRITNLSYRNEKYEFYQSEEIREFAAQFEIEFARMRSGEGVWHEITTKYE